MQEVLVNRLGGLSLPRKSVVRLTDRPDMTLDVYRGRKTTIQQQQVSSVYCEGRRARGFGGTGKTIFTSLKQLCYLRQTFTFILCNNIVHCI